MQFGHARGYAILLLVAGLPLFSACGGDNNNRPKATPTATRSQAPTATATSETIATATATAVSSATATNAPPTSTATGAPPTATSTQMPPTATATVVFTATVTVTQGTATATATHTLPPATATSTRTRTSTPTGTPTGSAAATLTPTGTPTGTTAATVTPTGTPTGSAAATVTPTFTATALPTGTTATVTPTPTPEASAHGSVNQVWVIDAPAGTQLQLVGPDESVVDTGTADAYGSFIFRNVPAGDGYSVLGNSDPQLVLGPVTVTNMTDAPDPSLYESQSIGRGYGYLRTRDGTLLAINVVMPGPPENGPYPTVIEYSGYDPANPDANQPSTLISSVLGYAAVGVNMRGTGCSGGAFQFFEPLQSTDGYDAVEAIAAQPWAKNHQVGMVGISYPGISQLFVAQLQPPHLAAIAPLSVIADTGRGTLYPGGILNNGFATDWAADRRHDAMRGGQAWSQKRIDNGDQVCIDNQKLRDQTPDILQMIADNQFYVPAVADPVSPYTFVHNIKVPVFLAGAYQDEQTGGYFATMLDRFTGTDKKHFTLVNGNHTEALIPAIFHRWIEFLSFYVRKEVPQTPAIGQVIADFIADTIYHSPHVTLPPDRFTGQAYDDALATYEAEPLVRVLFESGAGNPAPGAPVPTFEQTFDAWPIPNLQPTAWYFAEDGALVSDPPAGDGADSFIYDPSRSQDTTYSGGSDGIWAALPNWHWNTPPEGKALSYATAPLGADTVMIGSGSADLWIRANAADVDLQVTLSEIRPDGKETYVIDGWLRASRRKLDDAQSSVLRPVASHLEVDAQPLPADEFVLARVEIFPFGHVFRAGSRIRITIEAPGGDRPLWKFQALPAVGEVVVDVARSEASPSRVVLPVVPGIDVPADLPPCPSLRGQPCRDYVELSNTPVE